MATVVFTGVQGSGKTVLLSVLVKRHEGVISPLNQAAGEFYKAACETLYSPSCDWPPPNNPMNQSELLKWHFCLQGRSVQLVCVDQAGEAWRWFTAKYQDEDNKYLAPEGNIPEQTLKDMEDQFANAIGICLVLDLERDINESENGYIDQKLFVSATLNYLKKIGKGNIPIGVIITKCSTGGHYTPQDAKKAFGKHYAKIFQNRLWNNYKIICVDAVANTKNNRPEKGFSSKGLGDLLRWIAQITSPWRMFFICILWFFLIVLSVVVSSIIPLIYLLLIPVTIILAVWHVKAARRRCSLSFYIKNVLNGYFNKKGASK